LVADALVVVVAEAMEVCQGGGTNIVFSVVSPRAGECACVPLLENGLRVMADAGVVEEGVHPVHPRLTLRSVEETLHLHFVPGVCVRARI